MGEVYKAKDTRLDRTVAVKVLPEHLAESPERKQRFEREAKAISQLNHPHICTLYDVGEQDGVAYLVMEHIEGETLADRLKKGPLPLDKALEYGMQIADALGEAHRAGIVHRDLKPANVMLTSSGVKLLDFGLAKLLDAEDASGAFDAPTMQKNLTGEEAIIGTLLYMAPEQLERKPVDARTGIFAFGAMLYEMLSGKKTFDALWMRRLDSVEPQLIPDTEGGGFPFWSPDGRSIGFFATKLLKRVDVGGGRSRVVCEGAPNGRGTWNDRGDILFSTWREDVIYRVPASGGTPVAVTTLDPGRHETGHVWPQFLPDGNRFLYVALSEQQGWMLKAAALDATEAKSVMPIKSAAFFSPPGYLLFARQGLLMAQRVDPDSLELLGEPVQIARTYPVSPIGSVGFSVSRNGVLANRVGTQSNRLLWFDRRGRSTPALPEPGLYNNPAVSPDGQRLTFDNGSLHDRGRFISVVDRRGVASRFTFTDRTVKPQWSRDGRSIFFSRDDSIYRKDADGGSDEEVVFSDANAAPRVTSISPDGQRALVNVTGPGRQPDIWIVPLTEDAEPEAFLDGPFWELDGRFSPDGRFVAYTSDQSRRFEVYVRSYAPSSGAGGLWQVSTNGGSEPRWRGDGRELFYLTPDQRLAAVPVSTTPTFEPGMPETLFELRLGSTRQSNYDVSGDGQRFLVSVQDDEFQEPTTITLNWPALLDR